jgi:ADP-ribosyl-[dinitrogen reductase] hydrolase
VKVLAVDWSGDAKGGANKIWLAEARGAQLVSLQSGRTRKRLTDHLIKMAETDPEFVVGLDFAFSFPREWCEERSWSNARDVWRAMSAEGEELLASCPPPFWGKHGVKQPDGEVFRKTELLGPDKPKSVFMINFPGNVSTGSIRGMPHLLALSDAGFSIWPFDPPGWPRVVEIYPRALTGPVNKGKLDCRREYLRREYPNLAHEMRELAGSSEDAFDAAVSALRMELHTDELALLDQTSDPFHLIEGEIWRPSAVTVDPPDRKSSQGMSRQRARSRSTPPSRGRASADFAPRIRARSGTLSGRSRIRGCLLGGAVGDALGAPVEFSSLNQIRERFGPDGITDLAPAYGRIGAITDDTQMTLFTAEGLMRAHNRAVRKGICHMPAVVWRAYLRWLITQGVERVAPVQPPLRWDGWLVRVPGLHVRREPGETCLEVLSEEQPGSVEEPVNDSKGCGGVMRVAPAGILNASDPFDDGCRIAALTHGHPAGYLAAGFLASLVADLMRAVPLPAAIEQGVDKLRRRVDTLPEGDVQRKGRECLTIVEFALRLAAESRPPAQQIPRLGEGWVAEEALAIAVYCALSAPTFEEGVVIAVNHDGDSDSTGSITGNILGASLGEHAIPQRWLAQLELRSEIQEIADDLEAHLSDAFRGYAPPPELIGVEALSDVLAAAPTACTARPSRTRPARRRRNRRAAPAWSMS